MRSRHAGSGPPAGMAIASSNALSARAPYDTPRTSSVITSTLPPEVPSVPQPESASGATRTSAGRTAMLDAVFRDSPDGIVIVDGATGVIVECNSAIRLHLGCDPERLIDYPFESLYAPTPGPQRPLAERVRLHGAVLEERELARID